VAAMPIRMPSGSAVAIHNSVSSANIARRLSQGHR
jgi:hypothetical protein